MQAPKWSDTAQSMRIQGLMDLTDVAAEQLEQDYDLPSKLHCYLQ